MLIRIPRQKYAYIELDENDLTKKNLGSMIKKALAIIDKYATTDLEVVVDGKPMNEVQQFATLKAQEWRERYNRKYR